MFSTFTSLDAGSDNTTNSGDFMLNEIPKQESNDLLLESLDFNIMNENLVDGFQNTNDSGSEDKMTPFVVDNNVFESVFKNSEDPLLEDIDSIDIADGDLKEMFELVDSEINNNVVIKQEEKDDFEVRSKSTSALMSSKSTSASTAASSATASPIPSTSCKRSFSTACLEDSESESSKKDSLGCTPYTRKQRNNPLPPVVPKGEDVASMKRARNTEAARRSRARKMERMSQLEDKCNDLLKENDDLKAQVQALKQLLGQQ